jgi:long-chain acyl-CoA synthetase
MILPRIQQTALHYPDKTAIQMKTGDHYQRYTYRELVTAVASVAHGLAEQGIVKGDRVALLSENRLEWVLAYLSVVALGAVIVPMDAQLTDKEVAVLLKSSGAKAIGVSASCREKLPKDAGLLVISFDPGKDLQFSTLLTAHPDATMPPPPAADDLAALLYTSGTTGDPKGVMLSHGNLASNAQSLIKLNILRIEDNVLCILPLHHTYPSMACIVLPLSQGTTVTYLNSLKGPDIMQCMQETGVNAMLGVPQFFAGLRRAIFDEIRKKPFVVRTIVNFLLLLNGLLRKYLNMNIGKKLFAKVHAKFGPSFRFFSSGGARLDPEVFTDMARLGFTIIEAYGLTETSPAATFNPLDRQKAGSIGIPVPDVSVRIVNPDEHGQGEIAIRGPNVMQGYYHKPEETAEVLKDGWFTTGDLGYRDRDGYFFITGRSKEMIVLSTGKKIFPDELEKFYKQIPEIKEICLMQGERGLEAAVVPDFEYLRSMNLSNSRETIAFEIEDLAKDLPPYKRITGLKIFKDPLPATRLGKLKRKAVADLYRQQGERAENPVAEIDRDFLGTPEAKKLLTCLEPFSAKKHILPDDNLELDLGLDSLMRVELVVSIEKTFGIGLPESFGSEVFTVKDAVVKIRELLAAGPSAAGERVRLSWGEILAQEPSDEVKKTLSLDAGPLGNCGRYAIKFFVKVILMVYGRLSVRGLENLPTQGPFIIAPNHLSLADAPSVMAAMSWKIGSRTFFLGATEYFGGPAMAGVAKLIQVIPVDMDTRLYNALQLSAYVLRQGKVLCVFPEGTRARDGKLHEFKKGVGIIAKELNVPIVPVAISGTYAMLASGKTVPVPAKISVTFGEPVLPGDRDYDGIVKDLYEKVAGMMETSGSR